MRLGWVSCPQGTQGIGSNMVILSLHRDRKSKGPRYLGMEMS